MRDWDESRLEEEMNALMREMPESEELEKKIIRNISQRIRRTVLRTLGVVFAVLGASFLIVNTCMNQMYLNPYELNRDQTMLGVLRDYWEITRPYQEVISLDVEKKGFARYELAMQIADLKERINIGVPNVFGEMRSGKYKSLRSEDNMLTQNVGRFVYAEEEQDRIIDKIEELPKSAWVYLSVTDTEAKSIEELRMEPAEISWIQIYQPNADFQAGLSLRFVSQYEEGDRREDLSEEELLQVYLSNLENLLDHWEVWSSLGLCDGHSRIYTENSSVSALRETYEDAKTLTALTSKSYCVYGQRDEIVRFLEENALETIFVEYVRLW